MPFTVVASRTASERSSSAQGVARAAHSVLLNWSTRLSWVPRMVYATVTCDGVLRDDPDLVDGDQLAEPLLQGALDRGVDRELERFRARLEDAAAGRSRTSAG